MAGRILETVPRLIVDGLRRTDAAELIEASDISWLGNADSGGVPLAPYRVLLGRVLDRYGPRPLLMAGQALREVSSPILFVLLNTSDPDLLIQKERRLSRFIHSRHRVDLLDSGPLYLRLRHTSESAPPHPTENLASCGQHVVLLEEIGCRALTLRFPAHAYPDRAVYRDGEFVDPGGSDGFHEWIFSWDRFEARRHPMEGLDEVLLRSAARPELQDEADPLSDVEHVMRGDMARTWTVANVATRLGRSGRTLQRQLAAVGQTFSGVVLRIRTDEAARLLRESELSLTEIGYVCGFSDSAHFSRSFKKRFRVVPSEWRRAAVD